MKKFSLLCLTIILGNTFLSAITFRNNTNEIISFTVHTEQDGDFRYRLGRKGIIEEAIVGERFSISTTYTPTLIEFNVGYNNRDGIDFSPVFFESDRINFNNSFVTDITGEKIPTIISEYTPANSPNLKDQSARRSVLKIRNGFIKTKAEMIASKNLQTLFEADAQKVQNLLTNKWVLTPETGIIYHIKNKIHLYRFGILRGQILEALREQMLEIRGLPRDLIPLIKKWVFALKGENLNVQDKEDFKNIAETLF